MTRGRALAIATAAVAFGCSRGDARTDTATTAADSAASAIAPPAPADSPAAAGASRPTRPLAGSPRPGGSGGTVASRPRTTPPVASGSSSSAARAGAASSGGKSQPASATRGVGETNTRRGTDSTRVLPGDSEVTTGAPSDSVRGIISVVGTSFDSHVIVRPTSGRAVTLIGPHARTVGRLSGADVWVTGTRDEHGQLTVGRFAVRTVDGLPAMDGTLIARGDRLFLVTRDGKQHAIANPPAALRDHLGARVWLTGPLDRGPITFGIIEERR